MIPSLQAALPIRARSTQRGRHPHVWWLVLALLVAAQETARAQKKEAFSAALITFVEALEGEYGDERTEVLAALAAMARGLEEWDAGIRLFEASVGSGTASALPAAAAQLHTSLGAVYFERGRFSDALRELDAAIRLDPNCSAAHVLRGQLHDLSGNTAQAADAFQRAWAVARDNPTAAYLAVRHSTSREDALEAHPAFPVLLGAHRRLIVEADPRGTAPFIHIALLDDAGTERPLFLNSAYSSARALLAGRKYDEALVSLRETAASDPLLADPALQLPPAVRGIEELRAGHTVQAVAQLEEAAAVAPESSELSRVLAMAYRAGRRDDKALERFQAAIRLNTTNERAHLALASLLTEAGRFVEAEHALRGAVDALPRSGSLWWMLARVHSTLGRDPDLTQSLKMASVAGALTGNMMILSSLGRLQLRQMNFDEAGGAFERNARLNPNRAAPHVDLAHFYRLRNRYEAAIAEYVAAVLIEPGNVAAHIGIGVLQVEAGRYHEAVDALWRAVVLAPAVPEGRYTLANALIRSGDTARGKEQLEMFRQLQIRATETIHRSFLVETLSLEAVFSEDRGAYQSAVGLRLQIVKEEPGVAAHHIAAADALLKLRRFESAAEHLSKALTLGATPEIYGRLADVYDRLGRHEESARARVMYEERRLEALRSQGAGR